jgi:hypothetical protein
MKWREREMPLDPEIERELAAVDAGLAGLEVVTELEELASLASTVRAERQAPDPGWVARLDERAARGFPRTGPLAGFRHRTAAIPRRRVLAPAGAAATLLVAVGIGISQLGSGSNDGSAQPIAVEAPGHGTSGDGGAAVSSRARRGGGESSSRASHANDRPLFPASGSQHSVNQRSRPLPRALPPEPPVPAPPSGLVPRRANRAIESNAQLTLGADSNQVPDVADGVVDVTHRYGGIVVSSQVTHSDQGARASFDLAIPSAHVQQALADLSDLGHVQSSSEGSLDITAPTVAAHKRLAKAVAHLDSLRRRLAAAVASGDTALQEALRPRIEDARFVVSRAHNSLHDLHRRAQLARVALTVTSSGAIAGGGWSFGDALHDAGRVLTVTAGVLLICAAVAGPLALLAVLAWLAWRGLRRRLRERSLDAAAPVRSA